MSALDRVAYVCFPCGKRHGETYPTGAVEHCVYDKCPICGYETHLAPVKFFKAPPAAEPASETSNNPDPLTQGDGLGEGKHE